MSYNPTRSARQGLTLRLVQLGLLKMVYDLLKPFSLKGSETVWQSAVLLQGSPRCQNAASSGDEGTWISARALR